MYTNRGAIHVPGALLLLMPLIFPMAKENPNQVTLSLAVGAVVASLGNSTTCHSGHSHRLSHLGLWSSLGLWC